MPPAMTQQETPAGAAAAARQGGKVVIVMPAYNAARTIAETVRAIPEGYYDEIVVALGASIGGRPHHRIGDRYQDLKDLGHDVSNPAAV